MKRTILITAYVLIMVIIAGTMGNTGISLVKAGTADIEYPEGYDTVVSETDCLLLLYDNNENRFAVIDKRNGYLWESVVDEPEYLEKTNTVWENIMQSNVLVTITDFTESIMLSVRKDFTVISGIRDGVIYERYHSKDRGITIRVEISIDKNGLNICIPWEGIKENGDYAILSIEVLPFFGYPENDEKGYVFYPDGCGAIHYFNEESNDAKIQRYKWDVYGKTDLNNRSTIEQLEYETKANGNNNAMLPVFGMKKGKNAYVAVIKNGDCDSEILFSPSGYICDLTRISNSFIYRYIYKDPRVDVSSLRYYYEKTAYSGDRKITYYFLEGDNADYSGMAKQYREYLLENGMLNDSINEDEDTGLAIDFFMAVKKKKLIFEYTQVMTTFGQAEEILGSIKEEGIDNIETGLTGWSRDAYGTWPTLSKPNRAVGGKVGLSSLADYTLENNIQLWLNSQFTYVYNGAKGYLSRSAVYNNNSFLVSDIENKLLLLNQNEAFKIITKNFLPYIAKRYVGTGIGFMNAGNVLFRDSKKDRKVSRYEMSLAVTEILKSVKDETGYCAVEGANQYVLKYADRIYNLPDSDTGYPITDAAVPFIQMVLHGYIPYTSVPGNKSFDFELVKLKWIETGCMPYFELTYKNPNLLKGSSYSGLYSSEAEKWIDIITETWEEIDSNLSGYWYARIEEHEIISEDIVCVKYSNGMKVYINYGEEKVKIDNFWIQGKNYIVK